MNLLIQDYLRQLESLLKQYQLWQSEPLDVQAFHSKLPFCHDTMAFEQWLQFVFIEKMRVLVAKQLPLPSNFAIAPMAELMLANKSGGTEVTALLKKLDTVFGSPNE
ncbi:YqcC family protein [Pseudoalteromonas shioyasakiensis]|uniref:YqcC family protein n=1 Tax=Pseudoalteromonas shioyasakiensis TaxID=1190813 RepID=UPI0021176118|nr:YqcC family protein [Pseudoalteromonas shioyasakiensis]MCQ8877645.1 YqcC family protein [Pseudoalteromonas shioyasakiensis]